ncbi:MAG: transcription initiation factor IIB [Promethearchaeota archaeon]
MTEPDCEGHVITTCPECGNTKLVRDYARAEIICINCGVVIRSRIIDNGPEWRAFDSEQKEKRARVGAPMTYTIHDKGLSTMIDWRNRDSYGKDISPKKRAQIYRLRKWQRRIRISDATERNLAFALSELDRMASHLGLSRNVREAAAMLYRQAVEQKLIRGRSIEGVTAAALYAACRQCKVPRTLDEIAEVSHVSKKDVGRGYRFIARELRIAVPPTNPTYYIPRFASELNLTGEVQSKAIEILKLASENGLTSGRGPTGVAAAALYIASVISNERRTQRDVAEVTKVTEVTVRNRYKELVEKLNLDVPL